MALQIMEIVAPKKSYQDLLDEQKDLLQNQIEILQQVVAAQCRLTGVNPLAQEMAAGALSIKIGKRPRDLLNPKAVKYMQFVFSIKDTVSKRETREISAKFGVTVTQVRDFFVGQRSRVRKLARLSREKADRSAACVEMHEGSSSMTDPNMHMEPVPLDTMGPIDMEAGPLCSMKHDLLSGMKGSDRHFIDNIFGFLRKEESYSGQVKLLQWILRLKNPTVLDWFLSEGGVLILASWLSEAAAEEQTSVLQITLKVLHYLPLQKAVPAHMSAILQSVNKLRFYRTSDIAARARVLLSKWSKMLDKAQSSTKSSGLRSAVEIQDEMLLKQSITEVMGNELWDLQKENPEEALKFLVDNPDNHRKVDDVKPLKMLTASGDDSSKRRGVLSAHMRERRKVQMVDHPGQRLAARSPQIAKSTSATQSRPLSADDIQKAKMRAQYMQSKHGKKIMSPDEKVKPQIENGYSSSQASVTPSASKSYVPTEFEEQRKHDNFFSEFANPLDSLPLHLEEAPRKKCKRIQIPWRMPPEMKIDETWRVGNGENSKEVDVQKNRIRREKETIYRSVQEIPSDPREPWDREMDFDDSLTPEIPIEQLPDVEPLETPSAKETVAPVATSSESMPEPDLELLTELLKNPELVFALPSGQAGGVTGDEMVRLLDMIKANGASSLGNLAGLGGNAGNKVEVSLPSPTPSSDLVPNGQKPDFSRNPFTRQQAIPDGYAYQTAGAAVPQLVQARALVQHQVSTATILSAQPKAAAQQQLAHMVVPPVASLQTSIPLPEQFPQMHHLSARINSSNIQHSTPEMMLNTNSLANSNRFPYNLLGSSVPVSWHESLADVRPSSTSIIMQPAVLPATPQFPYSQERIVSNTLGGRQVREPIYHHQNNNYNAHVGGPAAHAGTWDGRNNLADRSEHESWSPHNSPSTRHEHLPGRYTAETRKRPNLGQHPGYQDHSMAGVGNKRWGESRR